MKASATAARTKTSAATKSVSKGKPSPSLKVTEQTPIASAVVSEIPSRSIVELTGSVTKDEAVALLLGWGVEPKRSAFVHLDIFGITEEQFRTLPSMGQSVTEVLTEQLHAAEDMSQHAKFINDEILAATAQEKIARCNQMISDAQGFLRDITADLVPGKKSLLEQAVPDDVSDGRILISVESLDRWAIKKYKFSIKAGRPLGSKPLFCDDSAEADDYGPLKAKNMMVTLALMVDLYVKIGSPYSKSSSPGIDGHEDDDTNASFNAIAKTISAQATLRCKAGYDEAQGAQTIRKLLSVASNELKGMLKK